MWVWVLGWGVCVCVCVCVCVPHAAHLSQVPKEHVTVVVGRHHVGGGAIGDELASPGSSGTVQVVDARR